MPMYQNPMQRPQRPQMGMAPRPMQPTQARGMVPQMQPQASPYGQSGGARMSQAPMAPRPMGQPQNPYQVAQRGGGMAQPMGQPYQAAYGGGGMVRPMGGGSYGGALSGIMGGKMNPLQRPPAWQGAQGGGWGGMGGKMNPRQMPAWQGAQGGGYGDIGGKLTPLQHPSPWQGAQGAMPPFMQAMAGRGMPQEQSRFAGSSMPGGSGAPGGGGMPGMPQEQSRFAGSSMPSMPGSPSYAPQSMGRGASSMGQGGGGYSQSGAGPNNGPAPDTRGQGGGDYGGGTDPYGQSYDRKGKRKFKGAPALRKLYKKGLPWQQDQSNYQTTMDSIKEILSRHGQISPEALIREQADVEQGRQGSQQGLQARMAQAGIDPSSPMAMSMGGTLDQAANRLGVEGRRTLDLQAEDRQRNDLNLMIPWLQAQLAQTTKKGGGGVQALQQQGGGGSGTDWAGALSGIAGQMGQGWAQSGFKT